MDESTRRRICDILSSAFLFSGISPADVDSSTPFLTACKFLIYPDKSTIQSARSPVSGIAVITAGEAEVLSDASRSAVLLRTMRTGESFGAATLYTTDGHYETVIRALGECEILLIPADTVKMLIVSHGRLSENYIRFLSKRICFLNQKITAFTAGSAEAKLAVYLSEIPLSPDGFCALPVSFSALADSLGMGRASLYRALSKFENDGIIEKNGKDIRIIDEVALQNVFRKNTK